MPFLTGLILAAFVGYMGGWYFGLIEGNMAQLMLVATIISGAYWLADKVFFLPKRRALVARYEQTQAQQQTISPAEHGEDIAKDQTQTQNQAKDPSAEEEQQKIKKALLAQPWWLDWTAGLFPVIFLVFTLRSFAYEPFKIPSGSMLPTLEVGDLILVNKWQWGLRLPVANTKITQGNAVQRGDVMVFRYPPNPNVDYIKRVVGLPGDTVSYLNKRLTINGQEIAKLPLPDLLVEMERPDYTNGALQKTQAYIQQYNELLGTHEHRILNDPNRPAGIPVVNNFPTQENCNYSEEGVTCKVPEGHYFVMGDNRDDSLDSRFWGFVPDRNIVGKAVMVWMNFGNPKRIGKIN